MRTKQIAACFLIATALYSCKKTYTCTCKVDGNYIETSIKGTRKKAQNECKALFNQADGSSCALK